MKNLSESAWPARSVTDTSRVSLVRPFGGFGGRMTLNSPVESATNWVWPDGHFTVTVCRSTAGRSGSLTIKKSVSAAVWPYMLSSPSDVTGIEYFTASVHGRLGGTTVTGNRADTLRWFTSVTVTLI